MESNLCAISSCKRLKTIGRFCVRHYGNKFWMKIRCSLEEIYKTQGNLHLHLAQVLPDPLSLKEFSTFLNFLRISYNLQDLKLILQVFSGKNNCIVSRKTITDLILMPSGNWDVDEQPVLIPIVAHNPVRTVKNLRSQNLSPFSAYKKRLSEELKNKFSSPKEAFKKFTKHKSLGFFEFSRMLNYLGAPCKEKTVKSFLLKYCNAVEMTEQQFKGLWVNKSALCKKLDCKMEAATFGICKSHERGMSDKGKVILEGIVSGLDLRTLAKLRDLFMDCDIVSKKFVKILFTPYTAPLTEENWEALAIYLSLENSSLKTPDQAIIMRVSI